MAYETVYTTDFNNGFEVNDTGKKADGSPCWLSRFPYGRIVNNNEAGVYADPKVKGFENTNPFPRIDGRRRLRSEKLETPIVWNGKTYNYSAALMTLPSVKIENGMNIETRFSMPIAGKRGAWPAFWLLPSDGTWPPEIDGMEYPQGTDANPWKFWFTQHWNPVATKKQKSELVDLQKLGITTDLGEQHTYRLWVDADKITLQIDNKTAIEQVNQSPDKSWYIILNMAMGGSWPGNPTPETQFPCDMILSYLRVQKRV